MSNAFFSSSQNRKLLIAMRSCNVQERQDGAVRQYENQTEGKAYFLFKESSEGAILELARVCKFTGSPEQFRK
jgi:hypothetical protein